MPTTLDCKIMGNVFGTPSMRAVFDSARLVQSWLDVWAALAEAQADIGMMPEQAATAIRAAADVEKLDLDAISTGIDEGRHILMPCLRALMSAAGDAGRYVHWGATTNDVTDTGLVLQVRDALDLLESELLGVIGAAAELAGQYADTPMAARTHRQHALPMTFGLKVAQWIDELCRHAARLSSYRENVLVAQIGGGAGTLASMGENAAAVQQAFASRLDLTLPDAPWYTLRDRTANLVSTLGMLAATLERINLEIGQLSSTEIGEVSEGQTERQVGSSTMPQKVNPINSARVAATCKMIRGLVPVMQGLMIVPHERDASAMTAEWLLVPQAFIMSHGALWHTRRILDRLQVFPDRMEQNLQLTGGRIVSEAVMYALGQHTGREIAHKKMIELSKLSAREGRPLLEVLMADDLVRAHLSEQEISQRVDPANHLGLAQAITKRVLDKSVSLVRSLKSAR